MKSSTNAMRLSVPISTKLRRVIVKMRNLSNSALRGACVTKQTRAMRYSDCRNLSCAREALFGRVVVQILPQPSLDFRHTHPLAFLIVGDLIAVDLAKAEISRFRVGKVEPTHA